MPDAYVLMTALPPTKGHKALIEFASKLANRVNVIVCTQPEEPWAYERNSAMSDICAKVGVQLHLIHKPLPQEPEGHEGFWDMWTDFLKMFGFRPGDYVVASEKYGKQLAEHAGGIFMPFDIERQINPQKATRVRNDPLGNFSWIAEEFQPYLRKIITVFGAESTGKTTVSRMAASYTKSLWIPEYARPYLENTSPDLDSEVMNRIGLGQCALQDYAFSRRDTPFIWQDTDLYSTIGYWEMAPWDFAGKNKVPMDLKYHALHRKSDLYIIPQDNIPFESDILRYGKDHREISVERWVDFAQRYDLPYKVLDVPMRGAPYTGADTRDRMIGAVDLALDVFYDGVKPMTNYIRQGSEYATA